MAEIINDEREQERADLEALVRSAGWQRFVKACQEQYSSSAQIARIHQLIGGTKPVTDNGNELASAREVLVSAQAVTAACQYPQARLKKLSAVAPVLPEVPRRA